MFTSLIDKCKFYQKTVEFLGYISSNNSISILKKKDGYKTTLEKSNTLDKLPGFHGICQ
jgi:hypothetical protein